MNAHNKCIYIKNRMTWTLVVTLIIQSNINNRGQVKCKRTVVVAAECGTSLIETGQAGQGEMSADMQPMVSAPG